MEADVKRMQVKELLLPFGSLKAFNLVMDKNTGNSKVCFPSSPGPLLHGLQCRDIYSSPSVQMHGLADIGPDVIFL